MNTVLLFFAFSTYGKSIKNSVEFKNINIFVGKWCASADNRYMDKVEMFDIQKSGVFVWHTGKSTIFGTQIFNPLSQLLMVNFDYVIDSNGKKEHQDKDNGLGLILKILADGKLQWVGPIQEKDFMSTFDYNLSDYLDFDARSYNMVFEPCAILAF